MSVQDRHAERDGHVHVKDPVAQSASAPAKNGRCAPDRHGRRQDQRRPAEKLQEAAVHGVEPAGVDRCVQQHDVHGRERSDAEAQHQATIRPALLAESPGRITQSGDSSGDIAEGHVRGIQRSVARPVA
jgi:hypothetical protein